MRQVIDETSDEPRFRRCSVFSPGVCSKAGSGIKALSSVECCGDTYTPMEVAQYGNIDSSASHHTPRRLTTLVRRPQGHGNAWGSRRGHLWILRFCTSGTRILAFSRRGYPCTGGVPQRFLGIHIIYRTISPPNFNCTTLELPGSD